VQRYLEERLAPRLRLHGTLLEVFGLGVLIMGESGIGKSECALEMIQRGHRLVADDVVAVKLLSQQVLMGSSTEALRHHMELRGIGIVNIKDLFGVAAVRNRKRIELVVRLVRWDEGRQYERLGIEERRMSLLGAEVPFVEMPVASGRNIAILLEVAARHSMLRRAGYNPGRDLVERLDAELLEPPEEDE
jgi:HPr kinase/phosphorylase